MSDYLPLLFMLALATVFAGASFFVSTTIFSTQRPTAAKSAPYESGIVPSREPAQRFPVRFYLVAMIFIIFDIEIIFLYPWAVTFTSLGVFGLVEMVLFIATVLVAYAYVWRRGGLNWD